MAPNVTAHFFAANDINGAVLHEITDEDTFFRDLILKLERDGLGSGDLTLSRMINFSGFASGTFQPEVFVRFIVHAYSDTVYYPWGFSQEKRQQIVVHRDEKGAEIFRFAGPGPKALLQRHALGIHSNLGGHWNLDLENGVWRWKETASIGRVLARILDEDAARADPSLPFLTYTFDQGDDSNGTPWADVDVAAEDDFFSIPIGTDFLTILRDMDDMVELSSWIDLGTVATPKYELNVIQGLGDDKTGSAVGAGVCLLKEGLNITNDSLTVEGQNLRRASHVIVEGADGAWKVAERPGFVSGDYVKYDKIEFTRTRNEDWLEKVGKRWLHRQDRGEKEVTIELLPGVSDATGYYFPAPDRVLWLDNIISVDTSYDGSNHTELDIQPSEDNLVTGLELALGNAGETDTADATAKSWGIKAILNKERPGIQSKSPNQHSGANGAGNCKCLNLCPATIPAGTAFVDQFLNANDPGGTDPAWSGLLGNQGGTADGANGTDWYYFKSGTGFKWQASRDCVEGDTINVSGWYSATYAGHLVLGFCTLAGGASSTNVTGNLIGTETALHPDGAGGGPNVWTAFSQSVVAPATALSYSLGHSGGAVFDEVTVSIGEASAATYPLSGSDGQAARCDHTHHVFSDTDDPTVDDDESVGYAVGTLWVNLASGDMWILTDATAGAAVWTPFSGGGGGGGAPTTADYLVGTAQGALSAEIVVGTTPGGELGGTWASPTVDATHSGSAHHAESHNTRHQSGGADTIKLDDLAAPDDNTDLNVSTSAHGLTPKLDNSTSHFLNGQGGWTSPSAAAGGVDANTTWTPALTATTTNPTLGSGSTATGKYAQLGSDKLWVEFYIEFGSSGVNAGAGNYKLSLPGGFTTATGIVQMLPVYYLDSGTQHRLGNIVYQAGATTGDLIQASATNAGITSNSVPQGWAAGDRILGGGILSI